MEYQYVDYISNTSVVLFIILHRVTGGWCLSLWSMKEVEYILDRLPVHHRADNQLHTLTFTQTGNAPQTANLS